MNPQYPIYVISKGRHEKPLTANNLHRMGVPFVVVVEPQEAEAYRAAIRGGEVLELPFRDLGQGSIPARNWVWDHATASGARRHWILDDNIWSFRRFHQNTKFYMGDGTGFRIVEDLADRYFNVPMAGLNYDHLVRRRQPYPPVYLNKRIYSMILLSNAEGDRIMWRGRYNEDTDLSLRFLKQGKCTILCNAFTGHKAATQKLAGGNTSEVYGGTDERREFAESLRAQHPDVVTVARRYGRWHHVVDYRPFRANRLRLRPDAKPLGDYGLRLRRRASVEHT